MIMSPGDIADRYSIILLKRSRLPASVDVELEYEALSEEISHCHVHVVKKLLDVNGRIWDLEAEIRAGKEGRLHVTHEVTGLPLPELLRLAEVGRRALAIRTLNAERVRLKNEINAHMGSPLEVKGAHASAT